MKKLLAAMAGIVMMSACGSEQKQDAISESEFQAKVDSVVGTRTQEIYTQSMEDLDRRTSIEVKPKADSIFNAWRAANP
jgi:outer membrane lipoprotein-sorting protein